MKKILSIIIIILLSLFNTAFAEVDMAAGILDFKKVNKKVFKYVQQAQQAKTYDEKEYNFLRATKYLKDKKRDDILLKASIYYLLGRSAYGFNDDKKTLYWMEQSCSYLEKHEMFQDNYLSFGCLMNILKIAKKTKNTELYNETLLKIEKSQLGLEKDIPQEIKLIYGKLFEYYYNNQNQEKADFYEQKIKFFQ